MFADTIVKLFLLLALGTLTAVIAMMWLYFRDLADLEDSYAEDYGPLVNLSRYAKHNRGRLPTSRQSQPERTKESDAQPNLRWVLASRASMKTPLP